MEIEAGPYQRRVVVTRHGERLDGHIHLAKFNCHPYEIPQGWTHHANWLDYAFPDGVYKSFDEASPKGLPFPERPVAAWRHDSPLTLPGTEAAVLLGAQMRERGEVPGRIFVSPALRSVATAAAIRQGLGVETKLCVEPALYEFFTRTELPPLLTPEELAGAGFPVDLTYRPFKRAEELFAPEPYPDYYRRMDGWLRWALAEFAEPELLAVAHSTSMDTATRLIRGLPPLSKEAFWRNLMPNLEFGSYLSSVAIELRNDDWTMVEPPPQPTPQLRATFDWRFMIPDLSRH